MIPPRTAKLLIDWGGYKKLDEAIAAGKVPKEVAAKVLPILKDSKTLPGED